jgi:hypothetical protein
MTTVNVDALGVHTLPATPRGRLSTSSFNRSDCDDSPGMFLLGYPAGAYLYAAGTGNAVTDLIFSIAKRDVTFFSGTAPISFL